MIRYIAIAISLLVIVACGSKTTIVLLPEDDGSTGSIVVENESASTVLDKPYTYTEIRGENKPASPKEISPEKVDEKYHHLLEAQPLPPVSFLLYFQSDSTLLTEESRLLIPDIVETAKKRQPCEITVIGHTDSKGSAEYNYKLALERASAVGKILSQTDLNFKTISIKSYGEKDPLVPTSDNTAEIKNRRVEIMIR